jgi:LCP family protein required for cell wall assembly
MTQDPFQRRRTIGGRPAATTPAYGAALPYPMAWPMRPVRKTGGLGAFLQGAAIGFVGGGVVMSLVLAALLIFFPPPARLNILLLGLDRRPQETTDATRSDTMILVTIYPPGRYVGMLSIPRDLYVTVPGGYPDRINTAYFYAEVRQPGSGPAAAMQTVRSNFGVNVDRYVRVDLAGFARIVDALGGIDLNVPQRLEDDAYPTYDYGITTVIFEAGPQHMDGEQALAYARIRHGSSDLQRAARQQLVLEAIFKRLVQPSAWPRLPATALALGQSVRTDLTPMDILRLAPTVLWVGPDHIDRAVVEGDMVQPYITQGGADVLLPIWAKINPLLQRMFGQ